MDPAPDDNEVKIECALGGSGRFVSDCSVERRLIEGALILVVRHPDGGFRRFEVLNDGRALAAADGVENAEIVVGDALIEVSVGSDRYRFPATIGHVQGS